MPILISEYWWLLHWSIDGGFLADWDCQQSSLAELNGRLMPAVIC